MRRNFAWGLHFASKATLQTGVKMLCPRQQVHLVRLASSERVDSDVSRLRLLCVWDSTPVRRYGRCAAPRDQWARLVFFGRSSEAGWVGYTAVLGVVPGASYDDTYLSHTAAALLQSVSIWTGYYVHGCHGGTAKSTRLYQ